MRVLVAGVGYRNLRDHSVGGEVADRLAARTWPGASPTGESTEVVVEDLSYNPIAVVQRLQDEPPDRPFDRVVFVGSVERPGRRAGTLTAYRWDGALPPAEEIHRAVTEAVTGVIALDNTLVVARHFEALPDDVAVIEVEPAEHEFGDGFSDAVAEACAAACELAIALATVEGAAASLPRARLGGG